MSVVVMGSYTVLVIHGAAWFGRTVAHVLERSGHISVTQATYEEAGVALNYLVPGVCIVDVQGPWRWDNLGPLTMDIQAVTACSPVILVVPWMTSPPPESWPEHCVVLERPIDLGDLEGAVYRAVKVDAPTKASRNQWKLWAAAIRAQRESSPETPARTVAEDALVAGRRREPEPTKRHFLSRRVRPGAPLWGIGTSAQSR